MTDFANSKNPKSFLEPVLTKKFVVNEAPRTSAQTSALEYELVLLKREKASLNGAGRKYRKNNKARVERAIKGIENRLRLLKRNPHVKQRALVQTS